MIFVPNKDDPTVKKYFGLEGKILEIVEDLYCKIDLDTGELVNFDYWYDREGYIPESEKNCEAPPDVKTEIDKLYKEYQELAGTPQVISYKKEEFEMWKKQMLERGRRQQEAARACASKTVTVKEFQRCRSQHLSQL